MPLTVPEPEPTVAMPVALLLHVPPPSGSLKVVVAFTQSSRVPVIADGNGLTITYEVTAVPLQPALSVTVTEYTPAFTAVTPEIEVV